MDLRRNSLSALSTGAEREFVGTTGHPILRRARTKQSSGEIILKSIFIHIRILF